MPKPYLLYLSHGAITVLSIGIGACSLQPTRDSKTTNDTDSLALHRVEISSKPNEPLPVVLLKSDPIGAHKVPVEQARDIWQRVRDGFALPREDDSSQILQYENWYRAKPDYLHLVTERAEPYLYFILEEIERRHLPTELALLPIIESAYIPFAYSRSRAAGIWQFVPDTGRLYGLKQDWWYDGRRDIYASTIAALNYLETLNQLFAGDWLNTLAAYNAGPSRVLQEIEDNRRLGKPTDFWHLNLPTETRNYIPKLLAVKALVQNPAKFGIKLWPIPNEPYLTTVDIGTQIDIALAVKLAGMKVESFQLLNPGFNRWATDPDGPHRLLLPINRVEKFKLRLTNLPVRERVTWLRHQIMQGQTLSYIAQRYDVSISLLQQTNGLHSSIIRAGSELLIPQTATVANSSFAAMQRPASLALEYVEPYTHVVKQGDSFWSIARSYDVSAAELVDWNGRSMDSIIKPGDQLIIWRKSGPAAAQQHDDAPSTARVIKYAVQNGDSLYAIARRFNVSITDLCLWNNVQDNNVLYPGQALTLYLNVAELDES
ncbi:MAG: LysM peptidoglycan-binding domain-containing protein [Pseudomonadota bacterium]|nr:LysM peptidoglycan-binding domain-containing protein [Pseudomonadota bacterium]